MKIKRLDFYILGIAYFHTILFFRIVSLFSSGSAVWALKQRNLASTATTILFALSFLILFANLSKLILAFSDEEDSSTKKTLSDVFKSTIGLLIIYATLVFITSSGVIIQTSV